MARHGLTQEHDFEQLGCNSQKSNRKIAQIASDTVEIGELLAVSIPSRTGLRPARTESI